MRALTRERTVWYPTVTMPQQQEAAPRRRRSLITFPEIEEIKLLKEAKKKGLKLATYLRMLVLTHPERASGAVSR